MYRGTWLVLSIPLLLAAFSVARPAPLAAPFPPAFDDASAATLATEFARFYPDRFPGSPGAADASEWVIDQLVPYGITVRRQLFGAEVPEYGRVRFENLVATVRGRSPRRIVVIAHRDDLGRGPGANDNASGTAALIVLARSFATPTEEEDERQGPAHTLVFLSSDGGALGGLGAAYFAENDRENVDAVINLDSIFPTESPALQFAGDQPRSPAATLVQTATARILDETGRPPRRPSALRQLIDLAFPLNLYEHAPFVGLGIPAVTITAAGDVPPAPELDQVRTLEPLEQQRFAQIGRAAQTLIGSVDQGLETSRGGAPYLWFGPRLVRGWAIQLVLIGALLPFLAAAVDLFARCRRRRIPLAPAVRSYRSRLAFWLFVGAVFALLSAAGVWAHGVSAPLAPQADGVGVWPVAAVVVLAVAGAVGWLVARERLLPRRAVSTEEQLAGHTVALLILGLIALLVVATNTFALLFLLPSLHAWVWLPQVRDRAAWIRFAVLAAGFAGPALLVWSVGSRFQLGVDAPAYLVQLVAVGYVPVPLVVLSLAWLAVAGQLGALAAGRYAPYPDANERPPFGPIRATIRRLLLVFVSRRRASSSVRDALEA
jgi:Peptidase family M28